MFVSVCEVFVQGVGECLQVFVMFASICKRLCMVVDLIRWSPDTGGGGKHCNHIDYVSTS
jgi:hypothetical protein